MRVLVTGAAGLTGGEVTRLLAARGATVVAVVRRPEQRSGLDAAEVAVADCADVRAIDTLLARCDALVHVAGIHLAPAIARCAALRRLEGVIVVSSAGIDSAHRASAAVYRAGENAILGARADAVIARPTMIYGSARDRTVHRVIRFAQRFRFLPLFGDGTALLQPIHYRDLAAALVALLGVRARQPIAAGGAAPVSVREAGEIIFAALGHHPRFVRVPLAPALAAARGIDLLAGTRWSERIVRTQEDRNVDNSALVALTGLHLRAFAEGVREEVQELVGQRPAAKAR